MPRAYVFDANVFLGDLQALKAEFGSGDAFTVPNALSEVRTAAARQQIALLFPDLALRSPSRAALARVRGFALKTGDAKALSAVDVELIALAFELLAERGDGAAVRSEPAPPTEKVGAGVRGWVGADEEGGWLGGESTASETVLGGEPSVSLLTADFAMQNVCLQMGVPVNSPDGRRVTQLRAYQLACDSCQRTTKDTNAKFCPHCGHATLARLACEYGADGSTTFFRKKNRRVNTRGVRYPIPQPRGGRHADLVMCQDDLDRPAVRARARQARRASPWEAECAGLEGERGIEVGYGRRNPNVNSFWKNRRK